jgi:hypothetical protein
VTVSDGALCDLVAALDDDRNGEIDYLELVALLAAAKACGQRALMSSAAPSVRDNGDGTYAPGTGHRSIVLRASPSGVL